MEQRPENLLVVDDDEFNRDVLSRMLARLGYVVENAQDGEEALDLIRRRTFDLVLLDNMMPGLSGVEVLQRLRKDHNASELPVIMVTAQTESKNVVAALNSGANDYITKPIDFPVASARIRTQLSRKFAEAALRESETRYALAAQGAHDGLWDWDLKSSRLYLSQRWKEVLGYAPGEIGEEPEEWLGRVHPADRDRLLAELDAHRSGETASFQCEHRMLCKDRSYRWVLSRGVAVCDQPGTPVRMAGSMTDVTEAKVKDPLTGLPNRIYFLDAVERALDRATREQDSTFAVLFLDLDRFKVVNDSLGHSAGDRLLAEIARRIRAGVRSSSDVIARFGGDEFTVLLEGIAGTREAEEVAQRVLALVSEPFDLAQQRIFPSASVGIALNCPDCPSPEDLLRNADTAMYRAKARGRACYVVFDKQMRQQAVERLQLESDLREALERGEIAVYYQPRVTLPAGAVVGFEALARWRHPKRGIILPAEFLPVAEETGLIVPLGLTILRQACMQTALWHKRYSMHPPLTVSVNLSSRQCADPQLVDHVRDALAESGLPPAALALEVTERLVVENTEGTLHVLRRLKDLGVRLKMDDFGTGYSSLNYLHQFPFDSLKIDQSFIRRMECDKESREIVHSMIDLAHNLGMDVIAEGVEFESQSRELESFGCEFGQGYLFSKPVPAEWAERLIAPKKGAD